MDYLSFFFVFPLIHLPVGQALIFFFFFFVVFTKQNRTKMPLGGMGEEEDEEMSYTMYLCKAKK